VEVPKPDLSDTEAHLKRQLEAARAERATLEKALPEKQATWESQVKARGDVWRTLVLTNVVSTGGSGYTNLADGSVLATGVNPIYDTITFDAETALTGIRAVLLEVLPDPSLPKNGPGRWGASGNFILDEFAISVTPSSGAAAKDSAPGFRRLKARRPTGNSCTTAPSMRWIGIRKRVGPSVRASVNATS
jgi:hypothetical protein